jgi:hypothetical protein
MAKHLGKRPLGSRSEAREDNIKISFGVMFLVLIGFKWHVIECSNKLLCLEMLNPYFLITALDRLWWPPSLLSSLHRPLLL